MGLITQFQRLTWSGCSLRGELPTHELGKEYLFHLRAENGELSLLGTPTDFCYNEEKAVCVVSETLGGANQREHNQTKYLLTLSG